jgi:hypothetical protein
MDTDGMSQNMIYIKIDTYIFKIYVQTLLGTKHGDMVVD